MIDIHNHALYGVDDGAKSLKESVDILRNEYEQGVSTVILTPHYRRGMFAYDKPKIEEHFAILKEELSREKIGIKVYLGCEFHVNHDIFDYLDEGRTRTLADSNYVLTEYAYETDFDYIFQKTRQLCSYGYLPIVAHVERYQCFVKHPKLLEDVKEAGAMIQVNANSVLGLDGRGLEKTTKKILKYGLADIIASDTHDMNERRCCMKQCKDLIADKLGDDYATLLFEVNPSKIFE